MAKSRKQLEPDLPAHPSADSPDRPGSYENASESDAPRDRIAVRAYELYLARGASDGQDWDDWLTAEQELTNGRASRED
jgi:hypothetical protein